MNIKKFLIAILALTTFFASCKKDSPTIEPRDNEITFGDETFQLSWGGFHVDKGKKYVFNISKNIPTGDPAGFLFNIFIVELPADKINKKLDLNINQATNEQLLFGKFRSSKESHYYTSGPENRLTGTNNWLKVTEIDAKANLYSIEFEMQINNKPLKGFYSGKFIESDYFDVAVVN